MDGQGTEVGPQEEAVWREGKAVCKGAKGKDGRYVGTGEGDMGRILRRMRIVSAGGYRDWGIYLEALGLYGRGIGVMDRRIDLVMRGRGVLSRKWRLRVFVSFAAV